MRKSSWLREFRPDSIRVLERPSANTEEEVREISEIFA